MLSSLIRKLGLMAVFSLVACAAPAAPSEEALDTASSTQEVRVDIGPRSISYEYAHPEAIIPAGVAGGEKVVFYGAVLEGRVKAIARVGGAPIGEIPPPPGGFTLPLIMHSIGPSRLAILDCGGFPDPGITDANPTLYEYEYAYDGGVFTANLARTVPFTGKRIGFAEEFVYIGSGRYLVPDAVYGSIWRVDSDGTVHPGIVPRTFAPSDAIPSMVYCPTMPQVTVGGLPFLFTGATIPGVASIAVRDGTVYFYSSCAGGLYRFPFSALFDSRPPWKRAQDIRLIASKQANVEVEELLEMQFNKFDPSDIHLYAADALQLRIIRIDPRNGRREIIANDPVLFNFPAALEFLPPILGELSPMVVLSNQQHRTPILNSAIPEDMLQPPFIIAKVFITR
jgi:hypothetical protein